MKALKASRRQAQRSSREKKPELFVVTHRVSAQEKQALADYALALSNESRARVSQNTAMRKLLRGLKKGPATRQATR